MHEYSTGIECVDEAKCKRETAFDVKYYKKGIYRVATEKKNEFNYFFVETKQKVDAETLERIKKLKIPPIWDDVWVSPDPNSKIQAVGIDKKKIKQYVYSQAHKDNAEKEKFNRVYEFIKAIPKLDRVLKKHKKLDYFNKERVISTILLIVKKLHIRVGKEVYVKRNNSFGISSIRKWHIKIENGVMKMKFKAKSNKIVSYTLKDQYIIDHINNLMTLEGDKVFQYMSPKQKPIGIISTDINEYIQAYMGKEFTVKDFRSYAANYYFVDSLLKETKKRSPKNKKTVKTNIRESINRTAHYLRHTEAISKKSYILNFAINLYENNPQYFIDRKDADVNDVLLELLSDYKNKYIDQKNK